MLIPVGFMWRAMSRKQRVWAFVIFMLFVGLFLLELAMGWVN